MDGAPIFKACVFGVMWPCCIFKTSDSSVVDQDIDGWPFRGNLVPVRLVRDIQMKCSSGQSFSNPLGTGFVLVRHDNDGPFLGKGLSDRSANPAGSTCDHTAFIC